MDVFEVGKTLGCGDKFMLVVTERLISELRESTLDVISIDVSLAANIVLETKQGLSIEIGDDTNLSAKLKLAEATIKELGLSDNNGGILDVSAVSTPIIVLIESNLLLFVVNMVLYRLDRFI